MAIRETKDKVPSKEEIREAERLKWIEERQLAAVRANEPIKEVFRITVAVDVVSDGTDEARAAVAGLKGVGMFVYGLKGVRRLEPLFKTSKDYKSIKERGEQAK